MKVDKIFVGLKAFIVNPEGKVLMLQESPNYADGTNAGKWECPGGRLDPGEHFYDGIVREVKEETGLDITLGRPFMVGEWFPNVRGEQWQVVATFFVCHTESSEVTLSQDHGEYIWIDPKDHVTYDNWATFFKEAFEAYLNLEAQ
jgi:8-oxo-dGTP diphosphatase